jgi:Cu/Ag efflux pump CusA
VRGSVAAVQDLPIDLPAGGQVRLGEVAAVTVGPVPAAVPRDAASRFVDVVAIVDGRGYGAVAADVERVLREMPFSYGFRAELQTDYADWTGALARMFWTAVGAVIVIFLLLQAALRSWRLAALALLSLPMALTGGLVVAVLAGGVLTIGSFAGLLAVFTLATGQVIALIRHCQQLEDDDHRFHRPALVALAVSDRLGPVLVTGLAIAAALLPIVLAGPLPGLELLAPMAAVVLGGLVTGAVVTLLVVPALYLRFAGRWSRIEDLGLETPQQRQPADERAAPGHRPPAKPTVEQPSA